MVVVSGGGRRVVVGGGHGCAIGRGSDACPAVLCYVVLCSRAVSSFADRTWRAGRVSFTREKLMAVQ